MISRPKRTSKRYADIIPHVEHYEETCQKFSWEAARTDLDGIPPGRGLNIAHEAIDRHAAGESGERSGLRWPGADGRPYGRLFRGQGCAGRPSGFASSEELHRMLKASELEQPAGDLSTL